MCKSHCGGYRLYMRAYRDKRRPLASWSSISPVLPAAFGSGRSNRGSEKGGSQPVRYPPLLIALFLAVLLMPFVSASAIPSAFFMIIVFATVIYAFRHIRGLALT